jgi:hypothetical protein
MEPLAMEREAESLARAAERQLERLQWVGDHPLELTLEFGEEDVRSSQVDAAIVPDRPLAGAHLAQLVRPVWTFWDLDERLRA